MDRLEEAMDQLQRDVLRFSEMLPDVDLRNKVSFKCFAAFPLFSGEVPSDHKQNCKVLLRLVQKIIFLFCIQRTLRKEQRRCSLAPMSPASPHGRTSEAVRILSSSAFIPQIMIKPGS